MLPRVVLRFHSTAAVAQRRAPRPKWLLGAVAAGVVGGNWFATSLSGPSEVTGDQGEVSRLEGISVVPAYAQCTFASFNSQ
jgi:hypothetical protein